MSRFIRNEGPQGARLREWSTMLSRAASWIVSPFRRSEYLFMIVMAVAIGVLGGFGAILFRHLITLIRRAGFGEGDYSLDYYFGLDWWIVVLVPAAGGLIVGPIVYFFAREAKGHGVPEVMEAVALKQGVIRKRIVLAKTLASAVSIGSGGSVGREGPIVQIGSAIGSALGQIMRVSRTKLRTMVGCGAAAGVAATFNAPVAGVLFALEVILGDFGVRRFTPIVISSVIATAISHHFLGNTPAFEIAVTYEMVSPFELLSYSALGVAAGLVAVGFIKLLYFSEDLFEKLPFPALLKPALGGLLIGVIGLEFPHIFGVGYETIELSLNAELAWSFLLLLVAVKLIATSLTIGSGGSGGIFAPSLFIGAVLGGALGHVVHGLFPTLTAGPGAYALVGMGAVVSAGTHAPLTAIMIIFEMTNDYKIILPLMVSCIVGNLIATRVEPNSIYTMKLFRRGLNLFRGRDVDVLKSLSVSDVLGTEFFSIGPSTHLGTMIQLMVKHPDPYFYVNDDQGRLKGIVAVGDLRQVILEGGALDTILIAADVMVDDVPRIKQTETLDRVMRIFGTTRWEELPVVDDSGGGRLIGVVTRRAVIGAYNREVLKRDAVGEVLGGISSAAEAGPVLLSDGIAIAEVEAPGWMVGKTLAELNLRRKRGIQILMINPSNGSDASGETPQLVPKPDHAIKLGDNLLVLGPAEAIRALPR